MINQLRLRQFKNFRDAQLNLDNFTLLVGTNASGKSNIRDAFRLIHGISRGYKIAEIFGDKWNQGGNLEWRGLRGGTREVVFHTEKTFTLELSVTIEEKLLHYQIEINPGEISQPPYVVSESLRVDSFAIPLFDVQSFFTDKNPNFQLKLQGNVIQDYLPFLSNTKPFINQIPVHLQSLSSRQQKLIKDFLFALSDLRFLDLNSDVMRMPSIPGQTILGDRGENLSSVLQSICEDSQRKQALLQWIQELTPMDAVDLEFPADFTGKVLLTLVEENGQKVSAISASDGTLRFLAMLAALLGTEAASFYFFEELDNGIHPTRLSLLLQLIEHQVTNHAIQIVATTHSPQLLRLVSSQSLESAMLVYRLPDRPDAKIKRIVDIPDVKRLIQEQDLARLHESGWLEDAVYFLEDEEEVA